jgi:hypothetical protein
MGVNQKSRRSREVSGGYFCPGKESARRGERARCQCEFEVSVREHDEAMNASAGRCAEHREPETNSESGGVGRMRVPVQQTKSARSFRCDLAPIHFAPAIVSIRSTSAAQLSTFRRQRRLARFVM